MGCFVGVVVVLGIVGKVLADFDCVFDWCFDGVWFYVVEVEECVGCFLFGWLE